MDTKFFIAEQDGDVSGGAVFERRIPVAGTLVGRVAAAAAASAFGSWSPLAPNARRILLLKAADFGNHNPLTSHSATASEEETCT
jgi:hypothetical protein